MKFNILVIVEAILQLQSKGTYHCEIFFLYWEFLMCRRIIGYFFPYSLYILNKRRRKKKRKIEKKKTYCYLLWTIAEDVGLLQKGEVNRLHVDGWMFVICVAGMERERKSIGVYNSILSKHIKLVTMTLAVTVCANDCWSE